MKRIVQTATLVLVICLLALTSATSTRAASFAADSTCKELKGDEKVRKIAKLLVKSAEDKEASTCYAELAFEDKAKVFEAIADERGLLNDLKEEVEQDKVTNEAKKNEAPNSPATPAYAPTLQGTRWQQPIEWDARIAVLGGPTATSVTANSACDGDLSDVDYEFRYSIASQNPNGLKSGSPDPIVDSMVIFYQVRDGGVNGYGFSSGPTTLCIGDTGVSTAGGTSYIRPRLVVRQF